MNTTRRDFIAQMATAALAPLPLKYAHAQSSARAPRSPWDDLRSEFLIPEDEAYFNAATLGAQPRVVLATVLAHMQHVERDLAHWDYKPDHEQFYSGYYPELSVREKIGRLINAQPQEIALTENATSGMNIVANGLDVRPGEEIVLLDKGHDGSRSGWELKAKRMGARIVDAKLPERISNYEQLIDIYERVTTANTRVWVLEHLTSATAVRFPVDEMCARARERGIFTIVDGAQSCGHLPVDVKEMQCDAFYTSASKWLLAPRGISFLYVREEALPRIWTTLASGQWDDQKQGAFRLMQRGSTNGSLVRGLEAALDFYNAIGFDAVHARIIALAERFRSGLEECSRARVISPAWSGTTTFEVAGYNGMRLQDMLWERSRVRVRRQGNAVRLCCHIWNSEAEVDRAVQTIRRA